MGFFSKNNNLRRKRTKKTSDHKHVSVRAEYLLNEDTPFNVTEAFRNLKATLSVSIPKKEGGRAIMLTSSFPEEGKTTVAVNLALMFAQSNAKVLILDADIRKGRVAKFFHQKSEPGLSNYLSGQNSLEEILHVSAINPNLTFITCGTHSPKPYELLESEEMHLFLQTLRSKYDYIIIDTPPVLLLSDALALSTAVDGTVLVCRHKTSYLSDLAHSLKILKTSKTNVLGVVINDYKQQQTSSYGAHKNYYYYSSYVYGSKDPDDLGNKTDVKKD